MYTQPVFFFFCLRFNYRSTHHLTTNGFYEFLNWFDERAWYPLGRIVGGTVSFFSNYTANMSAEMAFKIYYA